jgi:putative transposase
MKTLRPVREGLTVARPGERVEIDEWCVDLMSIIHSAKLQAVFGEEFLEAVGLDNTKDRWWLVAAIDCRTRVILGMKLTRSPSASAARECLRMIVSDKGQWADAVGALAPWWHAVVPETLVTDNGSGFKSTVFSDACLDLKIAAVRTIAGIPGMRGTIERLFRTSALDLMPRLKGRTFSNPLERGDYQAEDRACLDVEDLAFALVRRIVDMVASRRPSSPSARIPVRTSARFNVLG